MVSEGIESSFIATSTSTEIVAADIRLEANSANILPQRMPAGLSISAAISNPTRAKAPNIVNPVAMNMVPSDSPNGVKARRPASVMPPLISMFMM